MGNSVHNKLFWSIIVYNFAFVIAPVVGNLTLSVYLLKKRSILKVKLERLLNQQKLIASDFSKEKILPGEVETFEASSRKMSLNNLKKNLASLEELSYFANRKKLNDYHFEFLRTVTPCISFSMTHVILFLPYSIIDTVNQVKPYMSFMVVLQYMTYVRYLFYGCKFYLLLFVSYKFRKESRDFFRMFKLKKVDA